MRWNCTFVDVEKDIKKNGSFSNKKYDTDDFNTNLVAQNVVDLYFRQIQMSGEMVEEPNIKLSPVVGYTTTRALQCIHRKDDCNNRYILAGLRELSAWFWLKLASIFLLLSLILIAAYFVQQKTGEEKSKRRTLRRPQISLRSRLNSLMITLFLFCMRIITRQSNNRQIYCNLKYVRYLVLLVIILFTTVIHQVLFYKSFNSLKFRNTSFILKNLEQVLYSPLLAPYSPFNRS